jgi:diguanylate cyclase (GGDEF)-like protein
MKKIKTFIESALFITITILFGISFYQYAQIAVLLRDYFLVNLNSNVKSSLELSTNLDEAIIEVNSLLNGLFSVLLLLCFTVLLTFIFVLFQNYTETELQKMADNAMLDIATGLYNKGKCEEILHNPNKHLKNVCVFMIDLNNLKYVNDSSGHDAGDKLILQFSTFLKQGVPKQYFIGRYGGDEFIIVCNNILNKDIPLVLQKTNELIQEYNSWEPLIKISYASGYAYSEEHPKKTIAELLKIADSQMYQNKENIKRKQGYKR